MKLTNNQITVAAFQQFGIVAADEEILEFAAWLNEQISADLLRDEFAKAAMAAMITKSSGQDSTGGKEGVPLIAKYSYEYADAMLLERAK